MKIELTDEKLEIVLEGWERFWSLRGRISIEAKNITNVEWISGTVNRSRLRGLRAPGTGLPWVFYAGSFYRKSGWEFWYLNVRKPGCLIITTNQKRYRVVRVTVSEELAQKVTGWFEHLESAS